MIVNQWVPAAHRGDAVGDNARVLRDLFRDWGHDVRHLRADDRRRPARRRCGRGPIAARAQGDVTMLHFAVPSPMTDAFATLPGTRVLHYHNVTPAQFFAPFDAGSARHGGAQAGRELATLADRVDLALGVSDYNRRELETLGFARTGVLPIARGHRAADATRRRCRRSSALLQDGLANILFVGRIAPNKKIEDHIRLAEHYKRYVDVYYRFIFVGKDDAVPRLLRGRSARWSPSTRCCRIGSGSPAPVPDVELAAYYRHAHAYVSLSEHEGFCVPLVEAMAMDVPVLAYGAAAVPETLGGAGVSFAPKDLEYAAELLGALIYDQPLRDARHRGPARAAPRFQRRPGRSATRRDRLLARTRENRVRRSTVRHRDPRRLRIPLPPDRRAAGRSPPGRRADHLRARLHHLGERVPGRHRSRPRRHRAPIRDDANARHRRVQHVLRLDLHHRHTPARRARVAEAAGTLGPGTDRIPRAPACAVRRARSSSPTSTRRRCSD